MSLTTFATGQEGDVIFIDGVQWELLGKPIHADTTLSHRLQAILPENRPRVTSNWAGYTAYWSIRQGKLCLDSVRCESYDPGSKKIQGEKLPADDLLRVFRSYYDGTDIGAAWFTGDIRVATGTQIYYAHEGFMRNYEEEQLLSLDHGKVTDQKAFHNYVTDGFSFLEGRQGSQGIQPKRAAELREMFPIHVERYPELSGVKRILFSIRQARVDSTGRLVDCKVRVVKPDLPEETAAKIASEMTEAMKAYHPWRVSFINGEFRGNGIEGYTFPYQLE